MVKVERQKRHLSPTTRFSDGDGRLTTDGFRLMKDLAEFISLIEIEDGEIKTEMLEAQIIRVSTLFADEVIITSKVAPSAISEISVGVQVGSVAPNGSVITSVTVPVTAISNTGVVLTFTAAQSMPAVGSGNFGSWSLSLYRDGIFINGSAGMAYDDNFATPIAIQFVDPSPGVNPTYSIVGVTNSGPGLFSITGGVLNGALFKR